MVILIAKSDFSEQLDVYERFNYKLIIGMAFATLFLEFFSFLGLPMQISGWALFIVTVLGTIYVLMKKLRFNSRGKGKQLIKMQDVLPHLPMLFVLLAVYVVSSSIIAGYFGASADDAAFHTFLIKVILDNPYALIGRTTEPYATFYHTYPVGAHCLGALITIIFSVPIQKIVMMLMALFPGLTVLSFYSSVKTLFKTPSMAIIASIVSAFLNTGAIWTTLWWGGLPFFLSLYLSISSLGFVIFFLIDRPKSYFNTLMLTLLVYFSIYVYPTALLFLSIWLFIIFVYKVSIIKRFKISTVKLFKAIYCRAWVPALLTLIPLLFVLPYLFSLYLIFFSSPVVVGGESLILNIGVREIIIDSSSLPNLLSLYFGKLLKLASFSIFLIPPLILVTVSKVSARDRERRTLEATVLNQCLLVFLLLYMLYLSDFSIGRIIPYMIFLTPRVFAYLVIPGVILTSLALYSIIDGVKIAKNIMRLEKMLLKIRGSRIQIIGVISFLVFNTCIIGTVFKDNLFQDGFQEFQNQLGFIKRELTNYQILTQDDIQLMEWIRDHTPRDSTILASHGDAGQYVAVISQRKTVYHALLAELYGCPSNISILPTLFYFNITHIYIGSKVGKSWVGSESSRTHLDPDKLLLVPYFKLEKRFGNSYLIRFDRDLALGTIKATNASKC